MEDDVFDCQSCGACCVSDYDTPDYVLLTDEEADRLVEEGLAGHVYEERTYGKPMLSMKTIRDSRGNCRCTALKGTIGEDVSCSIYDIRPGVCQKFKPGSAVCQVARQIALGVSDR